jgi:hypothetical protein
MAMTLIGFVCINAGFLYAAFNSLLPIEAKFIVVGLQALGNSLFAAAFAD